MRKVASILIKIPVVWQLPFWRWLVAALGLAASLGWTEDARAQAANGLDVQTAGHGEPELVFLSGPDAPGDAWDHVAARFEVACRCHVVASAWTDHAPDALAGEVVAYIRAQGMVRPVLIGRGHGGALALTVAAQAPDLPGRLVLVDSLPAPVSADLRRVRCPVLVLDAQPARRAHRAVPGVRFARLGKADDLDGFTNALRRELLAGWR